MLGKPPSRYAPFLGTVMHVRTTMSVHPADGCTTGDGRFWPQDQGPVGRCPMLFEADRTDADSLNGRTGLLETDRTARDLTHGTGLGTTF